MTATYPPSDPFVSGLGNLCTATSAYTLGPCYYSPDEYREDISEGQPGVPMALVLKLVDASCNPISGADIEIWFCNYAGLYSGDTSDSADASSFNSGFCTDNDSEALAAKWFRGVQTTDADGNVYFKACFPGWYPSRTTHIHFRIVQDGLELLVSQFCFDDDLSNDIYLNHSDYTGQAKDTSNNSDTVFDANYEQYQFIVERQADNSMLAYKAIQIA
ncbi:intradiol ring-cleavage dioxygenase [Halioxenophilus sp. WMMB6]|uniref:dioxygenase family protein n=1 Tax=Halioxenophilus sp. WMMB6 TaxID=3073815 RepID=UPI00295E2E6A|nr:intradiol ring-cleavage dioxygenase [Halioxenophilus sp. WMMB6]